LAAALGTKVSIALTKKLGTGFFGGEGFILQKLIGDGMAFVHAGGSIIKKELHNESLIIETGSLVGFSGDIDFDIKVINKMSSIFFGGEGAFLSKLSGTGTVYLQTMPFTKFVEVIQSRLNYKTILENLKK
jgi:uncharacterized protein (AIM24 family)